MASSERAGHGVGPSSARARQGASPKAPDVDFQALNAALGAPTAPPSPSPVSVESRGQSAAAYASARPHAIPKAHAPKDDPNAPAVIVRPDAVDVPTPSPPTPNPQKITLPMGGAQFRAGAASSGHQRAFGAPGPLPSPAQPFRPSPVGLPPGADPGHMGAARLHHAARRPPLKPTLVLRRGPTRTQKALVFIAMLLIVVGSGIGFLAYYRPETFSFGALRLPPVAQPAETGAAAAAEPLPPAQVKPVPSAVVTTTAAPSAVAPSAAPAEAPTPEPALP